jgi:hypothetical protein
VDLSGIIAALQALPPNQVERHLCGVCCELLSVSGAAVTVTADDVPPALLCSSGSTARGLEDLQTTLGEGPSVDARRLGVPVGQAAGMLAVRLGTTVGEALVRLRAHAYSEDRPLAEIAREVLAGRLSID